ncbi:acyl-CoA dehydrogenase [Mycobacteriaceae bacterium NPDC060252]
MNTANQTWLGLGLTRDHLALAESTAAFAHRHLTTESLRAIVADIDAGAGDRVPDYWNHIADQGLLGLHIPEQYGGSGAGLLELAVVLEVLGRHLIPSAYTPTVFTAAILTAEGGENAANLLPGISSGAVRGAVALETSLTGSYGADGVTIRGSAAAVGLATADVAVVPVDVAGVRTWIVLDTSGLHVRQGSAIDLSRGTAVLTVDEVTVPVHRVLRNVDDRWFAALASVIFGAEAVGVASRCVEMAAEYAKIRVQFGRPIGQFQGVKHRCAQAAVGLEQARAVVWDAAQALDNEDETAEYAAAVACLVAPDAAVSAARDAMQVLGGVGYTWEHDAHLYYRRAVTLRGVLGRSREAAETVARLAIRGDTRTVRYDLPDYAEPYRAQVREALTEIAQLDEREQLPLLGDGGWVMPFLESPLGRDAGPVEQVVIAEELERAGIIAPQLGLAAWLMPSVALHGSEEQKRDLVEPTLRGEILWCQMFSEPEAGSDLASLRTVARRTDGGWIVNGQKIWTSLGFIAEWGVLLARTDQFAPKHQGITYFLVKMDSDGITRRPLREASGGALFSEIFFDDVFIPDSGVVGEVNQGWQVARGTLGNERVALGKGLALNANIDDLLAFARARLDDGIPLESVGRIVAENQAMSTINGRTLLKQLQGMDTSAVSNVGKYLSMRVGQQIADFCHAELGSAGVYDEADPLSRNWIEKTISSRPMTVYGGTTEVQLNVIGERVLGLPRDPEPGTAA